MGNVGDQRDALLDAAKLTFARFGFQGASLRSIAADAHVTPALASYYFNDKAGLLAAVIDQRVAPLVQALLPFRPVHVLLWSTNQNLPVARLFRVVLEVSAMRSS